MKTFDNIYIDNQGISIIEAFCVNQKHSKLQGNFIPSNNFNKRYLDNRGLLLTNMFAGLSEKKLYFFLDDKTDTLMTEALMMVDITKVLQGTVK